MTEGLSLTSFRVVQAPAARVFAAFTDREALKRWRSGTGIAAELLSFDARPGGEWITFIQPGSLPAYTEHLVFDVVAAPTALEWHSLSDPKHRVRVDLEPQGAATRVTWRDTYESADYFAHVQRIHDKMAEARFDRLEAELARAP